MKMSNFKMMDKKEVVEIETKGGKKIHVWNVFSMTQ